MNAHLSDSYFAPSFATSASASCPLTTYLQCLEELCQSGEQLASQLFELQSYVATDIWVASIGLWRGDYAQQNQGCQPYLFFKGLEAHARYIDCSTRHSLQEAELNAKTTVLNTGDRMARGLDYWWADYWTDAWRARCKDAC